MSPYAATPGGTTVLARSYTFLSCTFPGDVGDTAATRTRRFSLRPALRLPALLRLRATTTWVFSVCRFFLPE